MNRIILAAQFANECHISQKRKYNCVPYINHVIRVAGRVATLSNTTEDMVCAAWLHDTIEDCNVTPLRLSVFGGQVSQIVVELTNPSIYCPDQNRATRKAIDRQHIATISKEAKTIKLIDRIDNLNDLSMAPDDFVETYANESLLLAEVLSGTNKELEEELRSVINGLLK